MPSARPAIGGAYTYNLFQNGIADPTDGDWYLRAAGLAPTVPVYENYPNIMLGMIEMPTFQQRRGNIYMPSSTDSFMVAEPTADVSGYAPPPGNVWARIEAPFGHYEGSSDTGMEYDLSRFLVQIGIDGQLSESDSGMVIAGINAQYGHADADISSDLDSGDNSTDSFGGGLSLTWLGKSGSYVDAQASAHYLLSDLSSDCGRRACQQQRRIRLWLEPRSRPQAEPRRGLVSHAASPARLYLGRLRRLH